MTKRNIFFRAETNYNLKRHKTLQINVMVNPVEFHLNTTGGERVINIEPVYEEIGGGDLFSTGRYLLTEPNSGWAEIRVDGDLYECEWSCNMELGDENIMQIVKFIKDYNEPALASYLD